MAIADGMPRDQAQVLYVWVRNQDSRLRTLAIAKDMRLDLLPGDCVEFRNRQFAKLTAAAGAARRAAWAVLVLDSTVAR